MVQLKIHAITLIRNEVDIVDACLSQSRELFDSHTFVDMLSTDGTQKVLREVSGEVPSISVLNFRVNAKYQSEIGNELVRYHFASGADWVFLLDADEFIRVEQRSELEELLDSFPAEVMHLPWLNLAPTEFGHYDIFNFRQKFIWSGRAASHRKVAIKHSFADRNPDFWISMGNHEVLLSNDGVAAAATLGLPLLHVPIRSMDRLAYKAQRERIVLGNRVNGRETDGQHLREIETSLAGKVVTDNDLRILAMTYGDKCEPPACDAMALASLPSIEMPAYLCRDEAREKVARSISLSEVLRKDTKVRWHKPIMSQGSKVMAQKNADEIELRCQPIRGDGTLVRERYLRLQDRSSTTLAPSDYPTIINSLVSAAFIPPKAYEFSAWSELIPVLSTLLAISAPRRYVELGVHNGMSFFAACNAADKLDLDLECVAIDSWGGDEHAGFHSPEVFERFKENLARLFPSQHFIRGFFQQAADCFDEGSIDLLHIDGLHTYEAVRLDFETWLPKMSDCGIVMFHDTNVYQRDFGVWRYWNEVSLKYPSFNFKHSHGLGILYVGSVESPAKDLLRLMSEKQGLDEIIQAAFIGLGELITEGQRLKFELERKVVQSSGTRSKITVPVTSRSGTAEDTLERLLADKWWRRTRPFRSASNRIRKLRGKPQKTWPDLAPR